MEKRTSFKCFITIRGKTCRTVKYERFQSHLKIRVSTGYNNVTTVLVHDGGYIVYFALQHFFVIHKEFNHNVSVDV